MTPSSPTTSGIDWLARTHRGVTDFRLPTDGYDIPSYVFRQRTIEYLAQVRAQFKNPRP